MAILENRICLISSPSMALISTKRLLKSEVRFSPQSGQVNSHWVPGSTSRSAVIMVGRVTNNDVVIPSATVSKSHFFVTTDAYAEDQYVLVDSNSTNGTKINDTAVEPNTRMNMASGDVITLGLDVYLKFFTAQGFWEILQQLPSNYQ